MIFFPSEKSFFGVNFLLFCQFSSHILTFFITYFAILYHIIKNYFSKIFHIKIRALHIMFFNLPLPSCWLCPSQLTIRKRRGRKHICLDIFSFHSRFEEIFSCHPFSRERRRRYRSSSRFEVRVLVLQLIS